MNFHPSTDYDLHRSAARSREGDARGHRLSRTAAAEPRVSRRQRPSFATGLRRGFAVLASAGRHAAAALGLAA